MGPSHQIASFPHVCSNIDHIILQVSGGYVDSIIPRNTVCNEELVNMGHSGQHCHCRSIFGFLGFNEVLNKCTFFKFIALFQRLDVLYLGNLAIPKFFFP